MQDADDKEIIDGIKKRTGHEFQKSHFSETINGTRSFPPRYIQVLEDVCENLIPTRYMALSRNQELRPKKEAWQLENDRLRLALAEKDREIEILVKYKQKGII